MNSRSTIGGGVVGSGSSGRSSGVTVLPIDRIAKKLDQDLVINNEVVMQEFATSFYISYQQVFPYFFYLRISSILTTIFLVIKNSLELSES